MIVCFVCSLQLTIFMTFSKLFDTIEVTQAQMHNPPFVHTMATDGNNMHIILRTIEFRHSPVVDHSL